MRYSFDFPISGLRFPGFKRDIGHISGAIRMPYCAGVPNLRGLRANSLISLEAVKSSGKASHTDGTSFAVFTEGCKVFIRIKGNPGIEGVSVTFRLSVVSGIRRDNSFG